MTCDYYVGSFRAIAERHVALRDLTHAAQRDGQLDAHKRADDAVIGLLAEFAVCAALGSTQPDLSIHDTRDKTFGADLVLGGATIDVKCTRGNPTSWVVQRVGLLAAQRDDRWLVLTTWSKDWVRLRWLLRARHIRPALLSDMSKAEYRATKAAIYHTDLVECPYAIPLSWSQKSWGACARDRERDAIVGRMCEPLRGAVRRLTGDIGHAAP